jgi:murein DD-endopeptidase MepM/ murein hydrolase activator NlpD
MAKRARGGAARPKAGQPRRAGPEPEPAGAPGPAVEPAVDAPEQPAVTEESAAPVTAADEGFITIPIPATPELTIAVPAPVPALAPAPEPLPGPDPASAADPEPTALVTRARALAPAPAAPRQVAPTPARDPAAALPALLEDGADDDDRRPVLIRGSGKVLHHPFVPRRPRPLPMRLTVVAVGGCIVLSALFAVAPMDVGGAGATVGQDPSAFQVLAGAVVWHAAPGFSLYTAANGDTVDSIARKFNVQIGGIYELNGMLSGEEIQVGKAYKIPTDPNYGLYYRPPSFVYAVAGGPGTATNGGHWGPTTYNDHIWSSYAGIPPEGAYCGPTPRGSGDNLANYDTASFDLKSPNWNAYWVRGFTWYHFGVDLANPEGTPIHAAQSGEVIFSGWDTGGGGWAVKINHCNHIDTTYSHMQTLLVHVHDMVTVGQVIGLEGSTGWSTGPHLHFAVEWDNVPVDPMQFYGYSQYDITHFLPDH